MQDLTYLKSPNYGYVLLNHLLLKNTNIVHMFLMLITLFIVKQSLLMRKTSPKNKHDWVLYYNLAEKISWNGFHVVIVDDNNTCLEILSHQYHLPSFLCSDGDRVAAIYVHKVVTGLSELWWAHYSKVEDTETVRDLIPSPKLTPVTQSKLGVSMTWLIVLAIALWMEMGMYRKWFLHSSTLNLPKITVPHVQMLEMTQSIFYLITLDAQAKSS